MAARRIMTAFSVALAAAAMFVALSSTPRPVTAGDGAVYVSAARSLADGDGYRTTEEASGVPRYPPGLPLLLVPAALVSDGDRPMQVTALVFGALLLFVTWRCAVAIAGHGAGAAAALFAMASPAVLLSGTSVMADAPAAAATVGALWATVRARHGAAGFAAAVAAAIRLNSIAFVAGLGLRRRAWLVAGPLLCLLLVFQMATHGSFTGYRGVSFGLHYLTGGTVLELGTNPSPMPNWEYYGRLLIGDGGFVVPGLVVVAVVELWRRRRERHARYAALVLTASVATYLVYYFQSMRFLLPAFCVVVIYGATGTAALAAEVTSRFRSPHSQSAARNGQDEACPDPAGDAPCPLATGTPRTLV